MVLKMLQLATSILIIIIFQDSQIIFAKQTSGTPIHPTRVMARIKTTTEPSEASDFLRKAGLVTKHRFKVPRLVLLDTALIQTTRQKVFASPGDLMRLIDGLKKSDLFEYVEPDFAVHASALPNDAKFTDGTLWGLQNHGQSNGLAGADIGVTNAWDLTTGSTNVIVAVIDTGIRYTHQDLAAQMWHNPVEIVGNRVDDDANGYVDDVFGINAITGSGDPMDDNDHGTHVAGTIAAAANDGNPHVGVAWNVRLMACKFLDSSGSGYTSDAITCIDYAVAHGAKILNNSWTGSAYSQALHDTIASALQQGVLFVAAAGNYAENSDYIGIYPAGYQLENVISVAAIDRYDQLAGFSNYGSMGVNIGAPGVDIFSCTHGSDSEYKIFSGTSMACPHVAGVAALVASRFPNISMTELRQRLLTTATPTSALNSKTSCGGRVNAYAALTAVPTGIPKIEVRPYTLLPLIAGRSVDFAISVSDLAGITNATVTGTISGYTNVQFRNDGSGPDLFANDSIYTESISIPTNLNPLTIEVSVSAPGKSSSSKIVSFPSQPPPSNDNFANRIAISGASNIVSGSNIGATSELGEPNHFNGQAVGKSVWWSWTAPADMNVVISTFYSGYDTVLAVYTGTNPSQLSLIGSNDYNPTGGIGWGDSLVSFTAKRGTEYEIAVDGNSRFITADQGAIQLNLNAPPVFTLHPRSQVASTGLSASLQANAVGTPPLLYQWTKNGSTVSGATDTALSFNSLSLADSGTYALQVSTQYGTATSASATLTVNASSGVNAPQGLVAWWPAQSNATDIVTKTAGVATNITYGAGEAGQGFQLDGTTSMISCPSNSSWNVGIGPGFTVEGWINPNSVAQNQTVFEWKGILWFAGVSLRISQGGGPGCLFGYLTLEDETIQYIMESPPNLVTTNVFQHVAFTYDKATGDSKLYLNGTWVAHRVLTNLTLSTTSDVRIGASYRPNDSHPFNGTIDELSVYNRALSDSEIQALWLAGTSGKLSAPAFLVQPVSQTVSGGQSVQLNVAASGALPLRYQWFKNGYPVINETNLFYQIDASQPDDTGSYSVVISNLFGAVTSSNATLVVAIPPLVLTQPANQFAPLSSNVVFFLGTGGSSPMSYQWSANGSKLTNDSHVSGANSPVLSLSAVSRSDAMSYSCFVSNTYGSLVSSSAFLKVLVPEQLRIAQFTSGGISIDSQDYDGFASTTDELTNLEVQVSSDLINWTNLPNSLFLTNSYFELIDVGTNASQRFYRVKSF